MRKLLVIIFIAVSFPSFAQIDPLFPGQIAIFMSKAEDQYEAQLKRMALQTTGHIWLEAEVDGVTNLHKEFNDYLDSFNEVLSFLAQSYSFYKEFEKISLNYSDLYHEIRDSPSNLVAVALYGKTNKISKDLIISSLKIINDIKKLCFSKNKLTEKERMEILFGLRPKLREHNKKMRHFIKAIKYTSLTDVWDEISMNTRKPANKKEIVLRCLEDWKGSAWGDLK